MAEAVPSLALCLIGLKRRHAEPFILAECVYGELSGFRVCGGEVQSGCSESSGLKDTRVSQGSVGVKT